MAPQNQASEFLVVEKPVPSPLSSSEIILSGFLMICFILAPLVILFAYWPDKIEKGSYNVYYNEPFSIRLVDSDNNSKKSDTLIAAVKLKKTPEKKGGDTNKQPTTPPATTGEVKQGNTPGGGSGTSAQNDPVANLVVQEQMVDSHITDTSKRKADLIGGKTKNTKNNTINKNGDHNTISLNSLILILVAAAGFLGNMIYVVKSFTAFVGIGTFNKQWILWYVLKPFSAVGLAIIIYFVLNNSDDVLTKGVNLNGIVGVAALTGLFTDMAMVKLKDIFEVIVKPNEDKTLTKHSKAVIKIDLENIKPATIDVAQPFEILIPGENLNLAKLVIVFNGVEINNAVITSKLIKFKYEVPVGDRGKTEFAMQIKNEKGDELVDINIGVQ